MGAADPPDRKSTSTPVSAYNVAAPVTPASALGELPGENSSMGSGVPTLPSIPPNVPLILQPGMGMVGVGSQNGRVRASSTTTTTATTTATPPPPNSPPPSEQQGQGQGQAAGAGGGAGAGPGESRETAVELP